MARYFTIEQARQTLALIRPMIAEIVAISREIREHQPEVWPMIEKSAGNGGNIVASRMVASFARLDEFVHRVQDNGALIKDLGEGLVDFPALRGGREVYLCWKFGEEQLAYWHEIDAGFAGRQPLETF